MIVSGTGHRPNKLGGYGMPATVKLVNLARDWLEENKPSQVISGMALGWDYALAAAAFDLDIPFIAAVPFEGQEKMWPDESKRNYHTLLADASKVEYVCEPGYAPWKMQKRNEWMVDNSDLVLAVWNGTPGGTANCVRYAQQKGIEIVNLWDTLTWNGYLK